MKGLAWLGALIASLAGLFGIEAGGSDGPPTGPIPNVVSFYYGSRGSSTYEIYSYDVAINEETGETEIRYELMCGYETYTLPANAEFMQKLTLLADAHELKKWDGFHESDSMVLDGYGFDLDIAFDDGTKVSSSGSNCSPKGYSEAKDAINELFLEYLQENGITPEGVY